MKMRSIITCSFLLFVTLFILKFPSEDASPAPYTDYDNIRDLYELLLRNEALNERLGHQVVRKGGRDPSLRLRFGRRADPAWQHVVASSENDVTEN